MQIACAKCGNPSLTIKREKGKATATCPKCGHTVTIKSKPGNRR